MIINKPIFLSHLMMASAVAIGVTASVHAAKVGDTPEISKLRADFIKAVTSNNPQNVGKLVTEDYVMLQPNEYGPDIYGKKAYLEYRKTLDKISSLNVEPKRVITCGDWAFEMGKETMDWTTPHGVELSANARFAKVLQRTKEGWRYARTIRAWAKNSYILPPAPGSLFNAGYGTWIPIKQSSAETALAQEMMDMQTVGTKKMVADGDMVSMMEEVVATPNESIGEMMGMGRDWEINSREEYMAGRQYAAFTPYDDLRKYFEEGVVCENDMGFAWGQDITTGSDIVTGKRWIASGDFLYLMVKQKGKWRIGPIGILYDEIE